VPRSRRIALAAATTAVVTALVVAGVLTAGGTDDDRDAAPRTVQPGAPGEPARELTDEEAAAAGVVGHSPEDTAFVQGMIVHHTQALAMAQLVDSRTERADLPLLAERITVSQEAEIELLEQWLTDRGEALPDVSAEDGHEHGHDDVPGMATDDQLTELKRSAGAAFDRLFLDLMITHHQGALAMVDDLYTAGGGFEPAVDEIARAVEADQTIEILRMQELADSLG
jgi:uncharacterized protein (DUF305 family)